MGYRCARLPRGLEWPATLRLAQACLKAWQEMKHPEWPELTVADVWQDEPVRLMPCPTPFNGYTRTLRPWLAVMLRRASQINLVAASSLGKCPLVLMILRNWLCKLSMALVV